MRKRSLALKSVKLLVIVLVALIAALSVVDFAPSNTRVRASVTGPSPSFTNAPQESNCTACHSDFAVNTGTGGIAISGVPANYLPNQQIPVTVTVTESTGVAYGFQMTAIDSTGNKIGTYTLPTQNPVQLQVVNGLVGQELLQRSYIEHTLDGVIPTQFGSKSWTFTWNAPAIRAGKVSFYAGGNGANSDGGPGGDYIYTTTAATLSGSAISNFDADLKSDIAVYRPSTGVWYSLNTINGSYQAVRWGVAEDKVVAGDYDGDGKTDRALWRPSTGVWYVEKSTGGNLIVQWGVNGDIPVPGDYDGDLKNDLAVWRPSTGVWYILRSSNGSYDIRQFGIATDKATQGDFDGDAKTDVAVWRPSTGVWYIWRSTDFGYSIFAFGLNGDLPVQGDYDSDGKTDAAVYRPGNTVWYLNRSSLGFAAQQFGIPTDKPAPADYDGDGKTDVAVYRNGTWYLSRSSDLVVGIVNFGVAGDVPVPSGYIAQ
ncbi:MAG TPA: choice-of-anchor V domain-containing protein [Pyrinomonadaceae bacterium]|nr:choice-of-anchor V domain-containing protein [Pyrinomonadaceae bacterium]